jgi:hypothetical protein
MYAHPFFFRNNPNALVELRKVSGPGTTVLTSIYPSVRRNSIASNHPIDPLKVNSNVSDAQNEMKRSISPSYSSSSSINICSPSTSPLGTSNFDKLFIPSQSAVSTLILASPTPLRLPAIISPTAQRQIVSGLNEHTSLSSNDRGRLDLLTLALEYECRRPGK